MAGEVDWGSVFIPDAENTFVAKDPVNNKIWYAPYGDPVLLYLNTTKAPFDDKSVRKALSRSIDRQRIFKQAMNGYAPILDATGLSDEADLHWKDFAVAKKGTWTRYDPAQARAELEAAGLAAGPDGVRRLHKAPLHFTLDVIDGWDDWVTAAGIVAENMTAAGVPVTVRKRPYPEFLSRVHRGEFEICIGFAPREPTPYSFYRAQMGSATVRPLGMDALDNWHRFGSAEADAALARFEASSDESELKALVSKLQEIYVENAPSLPLFQGPAWGEFTEARFTGFPSQTNPYARLSPFAAERLLVILELRPKAK
jgi:peptide/nickel transport system substrate-binding protein